MVIRVASVDWLTGLGSKFDVGCKLVFEFHLLFLNLHTNIGHHSLFLGRHLNPLSFEVGTSK